MKKLMLISFLFLFAFVQINAQSSFSTNTKVVQGLSNLTIQIAGTIDTTNTLNSNAFSLLGFDKVDLYTYPLTAGVKLAGTSTATRKVSAYIQGSFDGSNWANIDTISTADSANTLITVRSLNLNNYRMPLYRLSVVGATSANDNTTFDVRVYAWRKD